MDFLLPDDLIEFRQSLNKYFSSRFSSKDLRKSLVNEHGERTPIKDRNLWQEFVESGALLAVLPEQYGGLGFGALAASLVLEEAGRVACPLPILENIGCGIFPLLQAGTKEARDALLPAIADGSLTITGSYWLNPHGLKITNAKENSATLNGIIDFVPSLDYSDAICLPAVIDQTTYAFFLVRLHSCAGVTNQAYPTFELLKPYCRLELQDVSTEQISNPITIGNAGESLRNHIALCAIAEMVGSCATCVSLSVEYAKTREQFGQSIGKFQAVSHKLANMHVDHEAIMSLLRFTAHCATNDQAQFNVAATALCGMAGEWLPKIAQNAIQVHGGIGFTSEYDLHLFVRRIRTLSGIVCNPIANFDRLVDLAM